MSWYLSWKKKTLEDLESQFYNVEGDVRELTDSFFKEKKFSYDYRNINSVSVMVTHEQVPRRSKTTTPF